MNKQLSRKARMTKAIMLVVTVAGFLMSACNPEGIVTGPHTNLENKVQTWVQETCPKSDGVHCDLMGQ